MGTRTYLTESQARALVSGGENEAGTYTRTQISLIGGNGSDWLVNVADGDFRGYLASTRSPSAPRWFKTLDAAHRAALALCDHMAMPPTFEVVTQPKVPA